MKNLIIDERIRDIELNYLSDFFNVIKLPVSEDVYDEISGHSDIFYCKLRNKIIAAPNAKFIDKSFSIGKSVVTEKYPFDVPYNVCMIGDKVVGSKYVDESINVDILVKQGYTKCSIAVTSDNSCITTDRKIADILNRQGIDALYIEENNIKLIKDYIKDNKDDNKYVFSEKNGFIGGATLCFDNKFVLFGDSNYLENREEVLKHLNKHNLELIEFKGIPIIDYGSGIFF